MADECETRLAGLGLTLPEAPKAAGNYVPFHIHNGLLFVAGQLPRGAGGAVMTGRLGEGATIEDGRKAAELACLNILAQAKAALGSLDRIAQVLRLTGYVNATPGFADHPAVMNGASDLLVAVLGDRGRHTRVAVGVASLPANAVIEIDAIIAVS